MGLFCILVELLAFFLLLLMAHRHDNDNSISFRRLSTAVALSFFNLIDWFLVSCCFTDLIWNLLRLTNREILRSYRCLWLQTGAADGDCLILHESGARGV